MYLSMAIWNLPSCRGIDHYGPETKSINILVLPISALPDGHAQKGGGSHGWPSAKKRGVCFQHNLFINSNHKFVKGTYLLNALSGKAKPQISVLVAGRVATANC